MDNPDFDFEFYSEVPNVPEELKLEVLDRLESLGSGKKDMVGASVAIERIAHGETPHFYQARIVAYIKPKNIAAVEKAENLEMALKGALVAIERKIRKKREKSSEPWKRPDLKDSGGQEGGQAG